MSNNIGNAMMWIRRFCDEQNITSPTAIMLDFPTMRDRKIFEMELKRSLGPMYMPSVELEDGALQIAGIKIYTTTPEDSW